MVPAVPDAVRDKALAAGAESWLAALPALVAACRAGQPRVDGSPSTAWDELDRPCSERAIEHARWCAARRIAAHDDERAELVHGDVHQWNTLRTLGGDGYKLVDPDGLLAEAEYDLGVLMREGPRELMAGDPFERAAWLAARTGLDATAIWEWGVVERVSTGLLGVRIGLQPVADEMLAAADAIATAWSP